MYILYRYILVVILPLAVPPGHLLLALDLLGELHLSLRRLEQRVGGEARELLRVPHGARGLDRLHPRRDELVVLQEGRGKLMKH